MPNFTNPMGEVTKMQCAYPPALGDVITISLFALESEVPLKEKPSEPLLVMLTTRELSLASVRSESEVLPVGNPVGVQREEETVVSGSVAVMTPVALIETRQSIEFAMAIRRTF